jgi:UDPglucose--hexose-1-phosphate uridylyltransferase
MGKIEFRAHKQAFSFHDPTRNFQPTERVTEIREDPLTGRTTHVLDIEFRAERPDVEEILRRARSGMDPFAAGVRERATPRFLEEEFPEGRFSVGEAVVIPNLHPRSRPLQRRHHTLRRGLRAADRFHP